VAKPDLGGKRQCANCGTKFFDLNKNPITCPKCGTIFELASAAPARASRAAAADDDETETEDAAEVVSLGDADQAEDGKVAVVSPDEDDTADTDDDAATDDDDTFLEEEEDDGDVSDLIEGDRDDDEER
jgi:uncharacterized protein (TIGR02300 family)